MNQATPAQQGQGGLKLTPSDIYFILFRHKTKIVLFIILGLVSGASVAKFWPELYQSNSKLLVRYVTEKRDVVDPEGNTLIQSTGGRDSNVLGTEIAILQSLDLAERVSQNLDPAHFFPNENLPKQQLEARLASLIRGGIAADTSGRGSNIINLSFLSEDPQIVTQILRQIIDTYLEMHVQIHRANGGTFDEYLTQQTDQLRSRLNQTEQELQNLLSRAGVIDIGAYKSALANELSRMQQLIRDTELELSVNKQRLEELKQTQTKLTATATNPASEAPEATPSFDLSEIIEEYENTLTVIEILESRERELLLKYTSENGLVKGVREQLSTAEAKVSEIERNHPSLFVGDERIATSDPADLLSPQVAMVKANEYRLAALTEQLEKLKVNASKVESIELNVKELERRRELEEANYKNFLTSLEKSRIDEALSAGKVNNITVIQNPTPASKAISEKVKFAGGAAVAIAALGLVWAFLAELLFDQTIKRPVDVQRELGLPLFLTLPDTNGKTFQKLFGRSSTKATQLMGRKKAAKAKSREGYVPKSSTLRAAAKSNPGYYGVNGGEDESVDEITPWDEHHPLHNYFEALRDKVISFFESKNLQHKPKLIGLTGLGEDPGVSTIASGMASCLSKTECGNVLLVDMTLGKESAHQFYKGEEVSDLEEALSSPAKAQLKENLYVVAEGSNGYKLPKLLPSRLNSIIPKLKASDFDYIVFDMPAVSPISATPRLASYMDVMLMVVESEKTDKVVVKQATELLAESKAHLGVVLNKTKSYVPKQLEQDFIGLS